MRKTFLGIAVCVAFSHVAFARAAHAQKALVAPLENAASLSDQELSVVSGAVISKLASGDEGLKVLAVRLEAGEACDDECLLKRAKLEGASYIIRGKVAAFAGHYTVQLEAIDMGDGAIFASAVTPPTEKLVDTLPLAQGAAEEIIEALVAQKPMPTPAPSTIVEAKPIEASDKPSIRPAPSPSEPPPGPSMAAIRIVTTPPGAGVYLGHTKVFAGRTPVYKLMPPGGTRVTVELDGYRMMDKLAVELFAGEVKNMKIALVRRDRLKETGVFFLCFGAPVGLVGASLALAKRQEDEEGDLMNIGITFASIGGAIAVTGAILLIVRAVKNKKAEKKPTHGLTLLPTSDGAGVGYSRVF